MPSSRRSLLNLKRNRRPRKHGQKKAGAPPGTLHYVGEQYVEQVRLYITWFTPDNIENVEIDKPDQIQPYLEREGLVWLRVHGLHETEKIKQIGQLFGLHPLTQEDILNTGQRPKTDDYEEYLFNVLRLIYFDESNKQTYSEQLSLIYGANFLITFQETDHLYFQNVRDRLNKKDSRIRTSGIDYLAYAIIDTTVDYYLRVLERFGDKVLQLESELLDEPEEDELNRVHNLRRDLLELRKMIWPSRELLSNLIRQEHPLISSDIKIYYEDVYDHAELVIDAIQNNRDLLMGMHDTYMSNVSNRMNEVMKVLSIIGTIFIPLTFIAGIYGMNFNTEISPWNMPELNAYYGYPITMGVMLIIALIMVYFFKRKGWL